MQWRRVLLAHIPTASDCGGLAVVVSRAIADAATRHDHIVCPRCGRRLSSSKRDVAPQRPEKDHPAAAGDDFVTLVAHGTCPKGRRYPTANLPIVR